jgi:hypothetical protein
MPEHHVANALPEELAAARDWARGKTRKAIIDELAVMRAKCREATAERDAARKAIHERKKLTSANAAKGGRGNKRGTSRAKAAEKKARLQKNTEAFIRDWRIARMRAERDVPEPDAEDAGNKKLTHELLTDIQADLPIGVNINDRTLRNWIAKVFEEPVSADLLIGPKPTGA